MKITKKESLKLVLFYLIAFVITAFTYIVLIEGMSFSEIDKSQGLRVILIAAVGAIFPVVISYYFLNMKKYDKEPQSM